MAGRDPTAQWEKFGSTKADAAEDGGERLLTAAGPDDLFTQEQKAAQALPWWKTNFFVHEPVLFGTWDGVFTSVIINIFGVIIFIRTGWMVANAGVAESILILFSCILLVLIPVLSAVGICERCQIQSGGVYFLVSHILGGQIGAAVGVIYALGQTLACAMVAIGFGESVTDLLKTDNIWAVRGIAICITILLVGVNVAGVKWVVKLQLVLLVLLFLGISDFIIGSFFRHDLEVGVTGYSRLNMENNTAAAYSPGENFFTVFGVFFSAFTGVLSGVNMSGDLKNPSESIPLGELTALATSALLCLIFVLILGSACTRDALLQNPFIAEKVAAVGFLLLMALYISSLSSILGSLYGAPRVLQTIASDNVIPFMRRLESGRGPNKVPVLGITVVTLISILFILVGRLNSLAKVATMPYLLTYAFINYAYVSLAMSYDLQQTKIVYQQETGIATTPGYGSVDANTTPEKLFPHQGKRVAPGEEAAVEAKGRIDGDLEDKPAIIHQPKSWYSLFVNRWMALVGMFVNFVIIFLIHWGFALAHIVFLILLYVYIGQVNPGVFPGISTFSIPQCVRTVVGRFRKNGQEEDKVVVTPLHPGVQTLASRLNEENVDYSNRNQYHQSKTEAMRDFD